MDKIRAAYKINPDFSVSNLAGELGKNPATIRTYKKRIKQEMQDD